MKTLGQRLYEHENPKFITVFHRRDTFRTAPFEVPNPNWAPDWKFLSEKCKEGYERRAVGHHIFSGEG